MADKKVTELTAITSVSGDDLLLVVNDPLGTPESRKVTLKNFFANVSTEQVFTAQSTFTANVTMTGTNVDITSDVDVTGALTVDGYNVLTELDNKIGSEVATSTFATWDSVTETNTAIRTLVADRMQVANTTLLVEDRMQVANTNALVNDRMQVANTVTLVNDRMQVANTVALVNDRIQIANADARYANSRNTYLTGTAIVETMTANTFSVASNTGFQLSGGGLGDVPATSNALNEGIPGGTIWFSENHLYIAVDGLTIKRIDLSTF